MRLDIGDFSTIDWQQVPATEHPGERGTAKWRTLQKGEVRIRMIEYSPDYLADHWCDKGHIILVISGELVTQLKDGRSFTLKTGMSYTVRDHGEAHRSQTDRGTTLFIVD